MPRFWVACPGSRGHASEPSRGIIRAFRLRGQPVTRRAVRLTGWDEKASRDAAQSESDEQVSLEDLGNIGEFVGAIGVVLSLIYLAIQIRQNTRQLEQNTRSVRSSSFHAAATAVGAYVAPIAKSEALAEILDRGLRGETLTDTQRTRFDALLSRLFSAYLVSTEFSRRTKLPGKA